jgi:hypothetical protein
MDARLAELIERDADLIPRCYRCTLTAQATVRRPTGLARR